MELKLELIYNNVKTFLLIKINCVVFYILTVAQLCGSVRM